MSSYLTKYQIILYERRRERERGREGEGGRVRERGREREERERERERGYAKRRTFWTGAELIVPKLKEIERTGQFCWHGIGPLKTDGGRVLIWSKKKREERARARVREKEKEIKYPEAAKVALVVLASFIEYDMDVSLAEVATWKYPQSIPTPSPGWHKIKKRYRSIYKNR